MKTAQTTSTDILRPVNRARFACWRRGARMATSLAALVGSAASLSANPAATPQVRSAENNVPSPIGAGDAAKPMLAGDVEGEAARIDAPVDRSRLLMPAWESGPPGSIPPSAAPDVVGAFRFLCTPGQLAYDDPIVFPGQPGKSHLHQFFGNTGTDSRSTYGSLRRTGESTCMNALNRSAYWIPAMLNGRGQVVRPDYVTVYYKRQPQGSTDCSREAERCAAVPRGLRYVFGYDMVSGQAPNGGGYFNCDGKGAPQGYYRSIPAAAAICPSGARLGAIINAPNCWDGKRLDSPNHRDHMAYPSYGDWGYPRCPATHPVLIPAFTLGVWYTTDDSLARDGSASWHLSSDEMPGMTMTPGSTLHADWFGAWDDATLETWTAHCIDRMLNCSGGDLGNGTQLREPHPFAWNASPRLVPVPTRPSGGVLASAINDAMPVKR